MIGAGGPGLLPSRERRACICLCALCVSPRPLRSSTIVIPDAIRDPGRQARTVRVALGSRLRGRDVPVFAFAPSAFLRALCVPPLSSSRTRSGIQGGRHERCGWPWAPAFAGETSLYLPLRPLHFSAPFAFPHYRHPGRDPGSRAAGMIGAGGPGLPPSRERRACICLCALCVSPRPLRSPTIVIPDVIRDPGR